MLPVGHRWLTCFGSDRAQASYRPEPRPKHHCPRQGQALASVPGLLEMLEVALQMPPQQIQWFIALVSSPSLGTPNSNPRDSEFTRPPREKTGWARKCRGTCRLFPYPCIPALAGEPPMSAPGCRPPAALIRLPCSFLRSWLLANATALTAKRVRRRGYYSRENGGW